MNEVTVQLIDGQFVGHSFHAYIDWVFLYSFILILLFLIMMSVAAQLSVGQLGSHPPHTVFIVNFFSWFYFFCYNTKKKKILKIH